MVKSCLSGETEMDAPVSQITKYVESLGRLFFNLCGARGSLATWCSRSCPTGEAGAAASMLWRTYRITGARGAWWLRGCWRLDGLVLTLQIALEELGVAAVLFGKRPDVVVRCS